MSKTILAFETSISNCSVSLLYKNCIYNDNKICNKNQTQYILPMIKKILKKNSVCLNEIDIIAIPKGPGNFIGTRTAIAIAQGLSLGLRIPIISLSTTLIIAEQAWKTFKQPRILIILKITETKIYLVQHEKMQKNYWKTINSKKIFTISEVIKKMYSLKNKWIVIGDNLKLFSQDVYKNLKFANVSFPKSEFIISLYLSNSRYKKCQLSHTIFPIYFQKSIF